MEATEEDFQSALKKFKETAPLGVVVVWQQHSSCVRGELLILTRDGGLRCEVITAYWWVASAGGGEAQKDSASQSVLWGSVWNI